MALNKPRKISDCIDCLEVAITRKGTCTIHGLTFNTASQVVEIPAEAYERYWKMDKDKFEVFSGHSSKPVATFYSDGEASMNPDPSADTHSAFDGEKPNPNVDSHSAFDTNPLEEQRVWLVVEEPERVSYYPEGCEFSAQPSGTITVWKGNREVCLFSASGWRKTYSLGASIKEIQTEVKNPAFPLGYGN